MNGKINDSFYMQLCLDAAWKYQGLTYPNPAVGSCIVDNNGKLVAVSSHKTSGSSHAELNVISKTLKLLGHTKIDKLETAEKKYQYILDNHNNIFKNFTIYVTLEPCNHKGKTPPCSILIKTLGFKKVIIGSMDLNEDASGGAKLLEDAGLEVKKGLMQNKCDSLLTPFKKWQENKPYIFFKLAISQNGVYSGGVISSLESRELVHKLRAKIDLLVIGGNTVRVDRPTLDCRLSGGKAPDVLIYSRRDDFDYDIPLFKVLGRKVFIKNSLNKMQEYRFIMIEGGEGMFEESIKVVDNILLFTAPIFKTGKTLQLDLKLKCLHTFKNNLDCIQWFKPF